MDDWLPTLPPHYAKGTVLNSSLCVADLWIEGHRDWDEQKLESVLDMEDAGLARQMILSKHAPNDTYIWHTKNSIYSVKSGYWLAIHLIPEEDKIEPPHGSLLLKRGMETQHYSKN